MRTGRPRSFCVEQALDQALAALIQQTRARFGVAVLIDCHSMPSALAVPDIVLGDRYGGSAPALLTGWAENAFVGGRFSIARNAQHSRRRSGRYISVAVLVAGDRPDIRGRCRRQQRVRRRGGQRPVARNGDPRRPALLPLLPVRLGPDFGALRKAGQGGGAEQKGEAHSAKRHVTQVLGKSRIGVR